MSNCCARKYKYFLKWFLIKLNLLSIWLNIDRPASYFDHFLVFWIFNMLSFTASVCIPWETHTDGKGFLK
jgi:hypothetical protein